MKSMVKKTAIFAVFLALVSLTAGCTVRETRVGFMSMQSVLKESKRAGELQQDLLKTSNELQNAVEKEKKDSDSQKKADQEAYSKFSAKKSELENKLNQEINKVLDKITVDENLDIILYKNNTYYGGFDITDRVIEKLDEEYFSQAEGGPDGE